MNRTEFNNISEKYGRIANLVRKSIETSFQHESIGGGCSAILFQLNKCVLFSADSGRVYHEVRKSALGEMNNLNEADFPFCSLICKPGAADLERYKQLMEMLSQIRLPSYIGFQLTNIHTFECKNFKPETENDMASMTFTLNKNIPQWEEFFCFDTAKELNTKMILGCTEALLDATKDMTTQSTAENDIDAILQSTMTILTKSHRIPGNCIFTTAEGVKRIETAVKGFPPMYVKNAFGILPPSREGQAYCACAESSTEYDQTLTICIDSLRINPMVKTEMDYDETNSYKQYMCRISAYCNPKILERIF